MDGGKISYEIESSGKQAFDLVSCEFFSNVSARRHQERFIDFSIPSRSAIVGTQLAALDSVPASRMALTNSHPGGQRLSYRRAQSLFPRCRSWSRGKSCMYPLRRCTDRSRRKVSVVERKAMLINGLSSSACRWSCPWNTQLGCQAFCPRPPGSDHSAPSTQINGMAAMCTADCRPRSRGAMHIEISSPKK